MPLHISPGTETQQVGWPHCHFVFEELKAWKDEGSFTLVLKFPLNLHAQRNEATHLFPFHSHLCFIPALLIIFFETYRVATISELTEETSLWACQKKSVGQNTC